MNTETLKTPGLIDSVEIIKDTWGISHIYANNQQDLFFAQGYNAARDRLFQFEIWRRRALGLLAEIQGEKALQHDIGARLLKFRGNISEELQHYHKEGEEIVNAFVAGVNAYIATTRDNPELLPFEFRLLNIEPGIWMPEVVISRHNALTGGAETEIMIANLVSSIGAQNTEDALAFAYTPDLEPKEGVDLKDFGEEVMALYTASRIPPKFTKDDIGIASSASAEQNNVEAADTLSPVNVYLQSLTRPIKDMNSIGSNNWIIAGSKTKSGFPILANDPHRSIEMPSLRYWAHLVAPGWNVIGGGEPVLPGISIGHNEHGAWGLTIFSIDQEDLYVYKINPDNPNQYWYKGAWVDMEVVTEQIPLKGQVPYQATLKYTRHGPVLHEDKNTHKAYALRAAWLDKGTTPYLASLRIDQTKTWEEFREACKYSGLPGENMIWADKKGNIGWQSVGATPIRDNWDGLLPVPGDGRYEWSGFVPIESMPHLLNPKEGHWQSANHNNVPETDPNIYSFLSAPPYRLNRIEEELSRGSDLTVADSMALQYDVLSLPARMLVPLLSNIKGLSEANDSVTKEEAPLASILPQAIDRLLGWDTVMHSDSIEASIFAQWKKELNVSLSKKAGVPLLSDDKLIDWLVAPELAPKTIFGAKAEAASERDDLLEQGMKAAIDHLISALGPDINGWQYGQEKHHHSKLTHLLSPLLEEKLRQKIDVGPAPVGGDESTINLNYGEGNQLIGASFRFIVDTSDWDSARGTNTPGQSGDPRSPHYDDLFRLWAKGEYFPVYYSREKVESVSSGTLNLIPELPE